MAVTQDAQGLAKGERAVVRRGHGKTAKDQRLHTELVSLEALTSYDQYGDADSTQQAHREENRDRIIVFIGQAYGIFHLTEFAVLTHVPIRRIPSHLGSPQAVLQRFGVSP